MDDAAAITAALGNLPQAVQLARLGLTRGATSLPDLPVARQLYATGSVPKRTRPRSVHATMQRCSPQQQRSPR